MSAMGTSRCDDDEVRVYAAPARKKKLRPTNAEPARTGWARCVMIDAFPHKTRMDAMAGAKSIIGPSNAKEYSTAFPSKIHPRFIERRSSHKIENQSKHNRTTKRQNTMKIST
jgi:hypothetical protein